MITWAKIIVIMVGILFAAGTVICCDVTIIKEIKKLRTVMQDLLTEIARKV